jgi:uncharacterized membrane-anchored protein
LVETSHALPEGLVSRWDYAGRALDWLHNHQRLLLHLGVALQLAVLTFMIALPLRTLVMGDTILLRSAPVDPRDLFRGDYVILSYEISRPWTIGNTGQPAVWQQGNEHAGKTIYVLLKPAEDGKHWEADGYQFTEPSGNTFIRGTVNPSGTVEYGIESYFVQEGQGHVYEQAILDRKLAAEVAVDHHGQAQLKRLVIE